MLQSTLGLLTLLQCPTINSSDSILIAFHMQKREYIKHFIHSTFHPLDAQLSLTPIGEINTASQSQLSLSDIHKHIRDKDSSLQSDTTHKHTTHKHTTHKHHWLYNTNRWKQIKNKLLFIQQDDLWHQAQQKASDLLEICHQHAIKVTHYFAPDYPPLWRLYQHAPAIIYYKGHLRSIPSITIVGTRTPHAWSHTVTQSLTHITVAKQWGTVSGLALGIDTHVHASTLQYQGYTMAILAHGLEHIYPSGNQRLAHRILDQGGVLVSEYPPYSEINRARFVQRNRLQSASSIATCMVQSRKNGGSMHTVRFALQQDRYIAVPQVPLYLLQKHQTSFMGNIDLYNQSVSPISYTTKPSMPSIPTIQCIGDPKIYETYLNHLTIQDQSMRQKANLLYAHLMNQTHPST